MSCNFKKDLGEDITVKVTFEQTPESQKGVNQADILEKNILGRGESPTGSESPPRMTGVSVGSVSEPGQKVLITKGQQVGS